MVKIQLACLSFTGYILQDQNLPKKKKNATTDRSVTNSCTRHGHVQENPYMVGKIQTFYEDYRNISNKIIILDCPLLLIAFARFRCFSIKFIQCSIFV